MVKTELLKQTIVVLTGLSARRIRQGGRYRRDESRMDNYTALKPVRLEDFKCNSNQSFPTPVQLVKHFSQQLDQQRLNYAGISLSATAIPKQFSGEESPLFQIPDWQLSSESSEDGESSFPWLPSHPKAVRQISDGSEAFEINGKDDEIPSSPAFDDGVESSNIDTSAVDKKVKRQYTCSVCKKSYRMRSSLEKHLKVPCEVRPYKCSICQKAFKRPDHLKAHGRMHTGERPYLCSLCGKTFRQKNHLQRHADRKHGNDKDDDDTEADQSQNSPSDVCGLEDLEDDEMRSEDQD